MASALMRRSVLTAALAAAATIASPLAGTALAVTAPTAPSESSASPSGTSKATRPVVSVTYNSAIASESALQPSTLRLYLGSDRSNNLCGPAHVVSATISCTAVIDLTDGASYQYVSTAYDATTDTAQSSPYTGTFTTDIPSVTSTSPSGGSSVGSITSISATFDEWIDTSHFTVDVKKHLSDGTVTNIPGSSSVSNTAISKTPQRGTITFAADSPLSTGDYVARFVVDGVDATNPLAPADNPNARVSATVSFNANSTLPIAGPSNVSGPNPSEITSANASAVPFSGYAPLGSTVRVSIYDHETNTSGTTKYADGSGPNDVSATTVTPAGCGSQQQTINGIQECPWQAAVDASSMPDNDPNDVQASTKYQYFAQTLAPGGSIPSSATASCASGSTNCTPDADIYKDTTGPSTPPTVGDAYVTNNNDQTATVTVDNISDSEPDVAGYRITAADPNGHSQSVSVGPDSATDGTHTVAQKTLTVGTNLDDGLLAVTVTALDAWQNAGRATAAQVKAPTPGNPPKTYSLTKEATKTAPLVPAASDSLVSNGASIGFGTLTSQSRIETPTQIAVAFNEPLRDTQANPVMDTTGPTPKQVPGSDDRVCLNDLTANVACVNHYQGTLSLQPGTDSSVLVWTAPSDFSLGEGHTFSVTAVGTAATCADKSASNSSGYSCEQSADPGPALTTFTVDNTAPSVHITGINGSGANNGIDATDIKSTVISGTTDADTSSITLLLKSSGGSGTVLVQADAITITPPGAGSTTATWSTSTQNLTSLADGTVTVMATATDGSNNHGPNDATSPNPDGTARSVATTLQARPTAPQNLSVIAGNGGATLAWTAPASTGGHPLSGYSLSVTDTSVAGSAPQSFSINGETGQYAVSNLLNGHAYSFSLVAANDIGSGPAATAGATPKGNTALSVGAPRIITFGGSVALRGRLTYLGAGVGGEALSITPIYYNGAHGGTLHATTDAYGNWALYGIRPAKNVTYVATFAGDGAYNGSSAAARVLVRVLPKITKVAAKSKSHLSAVTLQGTVAPNQAGGRVYIYEQQGKRQIRLASVTLTRSSTWSYSRKFGTGTHYVFVRFYSRNGNQGNDSSKVKFTRS